MDEETEDTPDDERAPMSDTGKFLKYIVAAAAMYLAKDGARKLFDAGYYAYQDLKSDDDSEDE